MALAGARPAAGPRELTDRETQILRLLADGLHHDDIAEQLFVSAKTIKNHLTSIYVKLGVKSAAQAVAAAYRTGIVPRPMAG
jgi:DNA-binding NarL/FixJ family response regulator